MVWFDLAWLGKIWLGSVRYLCSYLLVASFLFTRKVTLSLALSPSLTPRHPLLVFSALHSPISLTTPFSSQHVAWGTSSAHSSWTVCSYDAWDPVSSPCAATAKASVSAFLTVYGRREISRKPRDLLGVSNAAEDITWLLSCLPSGPFYTPQVHFLCQILPQSQ